MVVTIHYLTRNEIKVYTSETTIYTGIASGYSLNGNNKTDFFMASNAFDNLISLLNSRETKQEVAIDLLSDHIFLQKHDPAKLSWGTYDALQRSMPDSLKKLLRKRSIEETRLAVKKMMDSDEKNWVYSIINSGNPFYSIKALQNIKPNRISMSDLIKISYETQDAAICQRTLELLIDEFMRKNRMLKEGQTESVVSYFEQEAQKAYARLDSTEAAFLEFNKSNDIINYYEQTRYVAGEKERLYAENHDLEMQREANSKSLEKVNDNIEGRVYKILNGTDIVKQRERLSDIYNKIAVTETINKDKNPALTKRVDSLKVLSATIEKGLQGSMNKLYAESNTPNGIPTRAVLDEWLKTTLAFEQSKAKLTVMDKRKKEFVEEYRKFAPLGAILKKIERQIGVSEKEYLELLHGLSMARLAQQNTQLTSKITVVDPPYFPLTPNASKRMLQVIVGGLVGFILVLVFLLARALVNKTIQQPSKVKKMIGEPMLGIYPLLKEKQPYIAKANLRLMQQIMSKLDMSTQPVTIGFLSAQNGEGKTTIISMLQKELQNLGYRVERQEWQLQSMWQPAKNTQLILVEFPALDTMPMLPGTLPALQQSFLVCRANRIWTKIDGHLLDMYKKVSHTSPLVLLNGVSANFAEEMIGEVPKKRSKIRLMFKRLMRFQFGNRNKIK
jgi:uncharacterized protein involved in exopolysaccharide biosynthesis